MQQQKNCEPAVHLGGGGLLREHTHKKNCLNLGIAQKGGRVPPKQYSFHRCLFESTVTFEVGVELFNFGLTVYSTNAKVGLAPWAL